MVENSPHAKGANSQAGKHAAYKRFIDELVEISRIEVIAKRIREDGHGERTNDDYLPLDEAETARKRLLLQLKPQEKEMIAGMLEHARSSAVHDMASFLEWALSCNGLAITWDGEPVPASPYCTMHYDFVCRFEGDPWPDEDEGKSG